MNSPSMPGAPAGSPATGTRPASSPLNLWRSASSGTRLATLGAVAMLTAALIAALVIGLQRPYDTLYRDVGSADAGAVVAELDRLKVPYRLEEGGRHILVPADQVARTRLQLAGRELPLQGAVGLEIFGQSDFAMTDFAQRINYQRALQGELTRTILALDEVQTARVHLVLPDPSPLRRDAQRAKASVSLSLKPGRSLAREQVNGIQRLVAAAVPGMEPGDVTVIDPRGVALGGAGDAIGADAGGQLDVRRRIEEHLARKVSALLDRSYGLGRATVSVSAVINFDQLRVTTEEVLGQRSAPDAIPTGVIVRERQHLRDGPGSGGARSEGSSTNLPGASGGSTSQTDTDYQVGRRIEQLVATPGSVRRLGVSVVLPAGVSAERIERIRQLVAVSVGLDAARGDAIAVVGLDQLGDTMPLQLNASPTLGAGSSATAVPAPEPTTGLAPVNAGPDTSGRPPSAPHGRPQPWVPNGLWITGGLLIAGLVGLALVALFTQGRRSPAGPGSTRHTSAEPAPGRPAVPGLSPAERDALLQRMHHWLQAEGQRP